MTTTALAESTATPGRERTPWPARLAAALRGAAPALLGYAVVRALGLLVLAVFAARADRPLLPLLGSYDGVWYMEIAEHGYDTTVVYEDGKLKHTNIAFFPLFPMLMRGLGALGVPLLHAGVVLAALAGLAAAWGIYAIGAKLGSPRLGVVLAVLWGVIPHAVVQNMVYSESLFTALCAWALWAVLERRWVLAGALTLLAGLTRPTGAVLVGVVGLACVIALFQRRDGWRPIAGALLAPLGLLGYLGWCGYALGRLDAWFWMQREGWGTYVDFGRVTVKSVTSLAVREGKLGAYVTTAVLALAVLLLVLLALGRQAPWPVVLFAALVIALTLLQGGGYYHAKARFLTAAFPVLIPIAVALAQSKAHVRWLVLAALTAFSAWYGTYLALVWPFSP